MRRPGWAAQSPVTKTTHYTYDTSSGNLLHQQESDNGVVVRTTERGYFTLDNGTSYMRDHLSFEGTKNGAGQWLAYKTFAYDGTVYPAGLTGAQGGALTLERQYIFASPLSTLGPLPTTDTSFSYDAYGNQETVTTYSGEGQSEHNSPGSGTARTTTTHYDALFHLFAEEIDHPAVTSGVLTETATYDKHMATMLTVTDPNGPASTQSAQYDDFGRLTALIKPGDNTSYPTAKFYYFDNETYLHNRPVRYEQWYLKHKTRARTGPLSHTTTAWVGSSRPRATRSSARSRSSLMTGTMDWATRPLNRSRAM